MDVEHRPISVAMLVVISSTHIMAALRRSLSEERVAQNVMAEPTIGPTALCATVAQSATHPISSLGSARTIFMVSTLTVTTRWNSLSG